MAAAAGVACAVCSGLANGSWNLSTKPDAPRSVYAGTVWAWENIWFVANVLIPVFNTIFVLSVVGVDVLREIFNEAEPKHLWAIVIPSLAWGWGGVGFGQAIKRLGVALGTSIVMGIIIVIGTALPAALDANKLGVAQVVGVVVGVGLGIAGFTAGAKAGLLKDRSNKPTEVTTKDVEVINASDVEVRKSDDGNSFWVSMVWCLAGGVLSSMLQFAFVFGSDVINIGKDTGLSDETAAMPIWLLCFACNAFGHLTYSSYLLTVNDTWKLFWTPHYEHNCSVTVNYNLHAILMCALMAVAMPFHIHTYGIAAVLMGDTGAVFAWPVVMSSTVFTAQSWSVLLKEFEFAPRSAKRMNVTSLLLLVASMLVVGVTGIL